MKRKYIQPSMEVVNTCLTMMVCGSKDIMSDNGIDYGGVDEEGTKDPAARRHKGIWEDEEEEF